MTVSSWHVIWAYDKHIADMARDDGMTPEQIRTYLREECGLRVGAASIKDVLKTFGLWPPKDKR